MKGIRILAMCLALLCLTSCALMLEREYTETADHVEDPPPLGNTAYRVETYPALRAALLSYVEEGLGEGFLRCPTTYPGNLSVDLEKARRQLMEEDPMGCYALSDLTFRTSRIIAYYEVELDFTYKVDPRTLGSMARAASRQALVNLLARSLEQEQESLCVYLTAFPEGEAGYLEAAVDEAWQGLYIAEEDADPDGEGGPAAQPPAPGEVPPTPALEVELYPETGSRRVAVLHFTYPELADGDGGL